MTTTTSALNDSVKPLYIADYLLAAQPRLFWQQMAWVFEEMGAKRGSSMNFPIYENLAPATSTLAETGDVAVVDLADTEVAMTFAEYGTVVTMTERLAATAYTDVEAGIAQAVGYNLAESLDIITRAFFIKGANALYARGATRASMTSADKLTYPLMNRLTTFARARKMPSFEDGFYVSIIHPNAIYDLLQDPTVQAALIENRGDAIWNGEIGSLASVRLVQAANGKVHYGAGTSIASTTLNGATAAGDTSATLTSATGFSIGDMVTFGTLETTAGTEQLITEQALVTNIAGAVLTLLGEGNSQSNTGLAYAHGNGAAVTLAPNIYDIPLIGPKSVAQGASDHTGPLGEIRFTGPFDNLGRLYNVGWYGIWAFTIVSEKWLFRLETSGTY